MKIYVCFTTYKDSFTAMIFCVHSYDFFGIINEFLKSVCQTSWTYPHTRISAYPHIRIPAYPHTRISAYPHIRISAYPHIRIPAYPHIRIPAYPHIRIPAYPHTRVPAFSTKPNIQDEGKLNISNQNMSRNKTDIKIL